MNMHDEQFQRIKETSWKRPLTPEEQAALRAFLAAHPGSRESWEQEAALNQLLTRLPNAPVSSNFTARLMQAVQEEKPRRRALWLDWFNPSQWLPDGMAGRLALCSTMVCLGVISFNESQTMHRAKVARELANVTRVAALPRVEWLKDFDTINGISQVRVADDELLSALK